MRALRFVGHTIPRSGQNLKVSGTLLFFPPSFPFFSGTLSTTLSLNCTAATSKSAEAEIRTCVAEVLRYPRRDAPRRPEHPGQDVLGSFHHAAAHLRGFLHLLGQVDGRRVVGGRPSGGVSAQSNRPSMDVGIDSGRISALSSLLMRLLRSLLRLTRWMLKAHRLRAEQKI